MLCQLNIIFGCLINIDVKIPISYLEIVALNQIKGLLMFQKIKNNLLILLY